MIKFLFFFSLFSVAALAESKIFVIHEMADFYHEDEEVARSTASYRAKAYAENSADGTCWSRMGVGKLVGEAIAGVESAFYGNGLYYAEATYTGKFQCIRRHSK